MKRLKHTWSVFMALYELLRYDVRNALGGSTALDRHLLCRQRVNPKPASAALVRTTCDEVLLATCLYWKPVLCLQRSVCLAKLLRKRGVVAHLVIGYRTAPFFSHAWVEVDGRVVNDSPAYQKLLQVLYTA